MFGFKGDDLTVLCLFISLAAFFGWEAMKEGGRRRWVLGGLAAACVLAILLWFQIKGWAPGIAGGVTSIATDPRSWFFLLLAAALIFILDRRILGRQSDTGAATEASEPEPQPISDYQYIDSQLSYSLREASYLWYGRKFNQHRKKDTQESNDIWRMLDAAVLGGKLPSYADGDTRRVSRADLIQFAQSAGQSPKFLFPDTRETTTGTPPPSSRRSGMFAEATQDHTPKSPDPSDVAEAKLKLCTFVKNRLSPSITHVRSVLVEVANAIREFDRQSPQAEFAWHGVQHNAPMNPTEPEFQNLDKMRATKLSDIEHHAIQHLLKYTSAVVVIKLAIERTRDNNGLKLNDTLIDVFLKWYFMHRDLMDELQAFSRDIHFPDIHNKWEQRAFDPSECSDAILHNFYNNLPRR